MRDDAAGGRRELSWEGWFTLAVVVATVAVLARDRLPPAAVILGATVLLLLAGVISADEAFSGFSNTAPITVAALFVVARAIETTGALEPVIQRVMGDGRNAMAQLTRVVLPTASASAFLNNTPIVAMVAPQVADWAERRGLPPSRFLIPVSFAAILGGVVTLIGTSTNVVISGLLEEEGLAPLTMFELTPLGLPLALAGCAMLVLLTRRLLPDRKPAFEGFEDSARQFSVAMRVLPDGALDGKTLEGGGLRALQGVYCMQVERGDTVLAPVAPTEVLRGDDVLTFVGRVDQIVDLQQQRGLASAEAHHADELGGAGQAFFEVVVGSESPLLGQTLKDVSFRSTYQAAVLAIHRAGHQVDAKLGEVSLRLGDTLLILADAGFRRRWRETRDFLLIAPLRQQPPRRTSKAPLALLVVAAVVFVAGAGLIPILEAALAGAVAMVLIGAVSLREARASIDIDVLIVIAAAFGLSAAASSSGLAAEIADLLLTVFAPLGLIGALAGVLLATMALTELLTNNAAAVLLFPIGMSTAAAVGADPRPFVIAVAIGASLSFLTPIGYQTNLMVYGLGGYRFSDYTRVGIPLNLVVVSLSLVLIPIIWPFSAGA